MVSIEKRKKGSFEAYERLQARALENERMSKILRERALHRKRGTRVKSHLRRIKGKTIRIQSYIRKRIKRRW